MAEANILGNIHNHLAFYSAAILSCLLLLSGCHMPAPEQSAAILRSEIILTDFREIHQHVGLWVTIQGEVSYQKTPAIIGVVVDFNGKDLQGQFAGASGILETWVVTQEELEEAYAENGVFANRGPGRFYRLVRPDHPMTLAVAKPIDTTAN